MDSVRTKTVHILGVLGSSADPKDIAIEPYQQKTSEGHIIARGWQATYGKASCLLRFDAEANLVAFGRVKRTHKSTERMSAESLWQRGDEINRALLPSVGSFVPDKKVVIEDNAQTARITEVSGQVKLSWRSSKDDLPNPAQINMTLTYDTGEVLMWTCFVPTSYGPETTALSKSEAWSRAENYLTQIKSGENVDLAAMTRAEKSFGDMEPKLVWSRGGGGYGFDSAEKYFLEKQLRLAYSWEAGGGFMEIDANTGELLTAGFFSAKSGDSEPPNSSSDSGVAPSLNAPGNVQEASSKLPIVLSGLGLAAVLGYAMVRLRRKT